MRDLEALLVGLDLPQRRAVTSDDAPLAVIAGAGAGKTRVLTRRIAYRAATEALEPSHTLAVTFTRKAAGELTARLRSLGVDGVVAGTFHAVALAQIRRHASDRDRPPPRVLDQKANLIAGLLAEDLSPTDRARQCALIATEIEWAKARRVGPNEYTPAAIRAHRRPGLALDAIATTYAGYERQRRKRRLLDFDDLVLVCTDLLEHDEEFAAAQRWRFRHLFVDEFQDATPAQLALVRSWLGGRCDLFAVGDPDQAIYGFAGSDPNLLRRFGDAFPGASILELPVNHRSTGAILDAASRVLSPTHGIDRDRSVGDETPEGTPPTLTRFATSDDEADGIALAARRSLRTGRRCRDLAVLVRTNAQIPAIERAFREASIPVRVRNGGQLFARPEVRRLLDSLDAAAKAAPGRPFTAHVTDLTLIAESDDPEERAAAELLLGPAREYTLAERGGSVAGFRAFLATSLRRDPDPSDTDAVEIATFHRAKGLEWDVVFVAGLEAGLVPISYAERPDAIEEERRLCYVAFTRAREELHCSWAERRTFGTSEVERVPTPWIEGMGSAPVGCLNDESPAPTRERVDALRATLTPSSRRVRTTKPLLEPADRETVRRRSALLAWRAQCASAYRIPPELVLADDALRTLARNAPDSQADLVRAGVHPDIASRLGAAIVEVLANGG